MVLTMLILALMIVVLSFGLVVFFGAPYLPTLHDQQESALDLLNLKEGQTLLELGSGDGRILKSAARQGIKAIGFELNPILVFISRINCYRYRSLVTIKCQNFWTVKLPEADGVYVFLLSKYMERLNKKIIRDYSKKVKLVSFAFAIPSQTPLAKKDGLYLYIINDLRRDNKDSS